MAKDRLLITGSSGSIGKILTERLSDSFELIEVDVVREETDSKRRLECNL